MLQTQTNAEMEYCNVISNDEVMTENEFPIEKVINDINENRPIIGHDNPSMEKISEQEKLKRKFAFRVLRNFYRKI